MNKILDFEKRLIGRTPTNANILIEGSDNSLYFGMYGSENNPENDISKIVGVSTQDLYNYKEIFTFNCSKYELSISVNKKNQIQFKLITMDGFVNGVSKIFNSIILDDQFDIEDYQIVFDFIKKEIFIRNRNFDELYYTNFNFLLNELDVLNEEMNKLNIIDKDAYIEYVVRTRNTLFQKFFRESLLSKFDNKCAICGINKPELLVASHIVPFSKCETNKQMIDVDNGLLLCSMHDKLFDTGYITFDKDGIIIFSPEIDNPILCEELKLNTNIKLRIEHLNERRKHNLDFHNKVIFKK